MKDPISAEVVYVHPTLATAENKKPLVQFAAEVEREGKRELETFQMQCRTTNEANAKIAEWSKLIKEHGRVLIINAGGLSKYKGV